MQPIYVEILIHGSMDEVWSKTQTPQLHQQWDLRFSRIEYLPRSENSEPQRFLYSTRIGFGMDISGEGETAGSAQSQSNRTSALRFWSNDAKSLIREGSGYWKYIAGDQGIRFLTWYDYTTRFGIPGRIFDLLVFRPLLGWATAWSFDRLRLWIEKSIPPAVSFRHSLIHTIVRITLAGVWIYHGLVPKILFPHADELKMLRQSGIPYEQSHQLLFLLGLAEILYGVAILISQRVRALFILNIVLLVIALLLVAVHSSEYITAAFNPISLNSALISLSFIGLLTEGGTASSRRCLRKAPQSI